MAIEIVKITDEEIVGLETREIRIPIEGLRNYALKNGFEHGGVWYFRKSWMRHVDSCLLEQSGLIKKVGTPNSLRDKGIPVPFKGEYRGRGCGPVKIYRINNDKLNKIISEKK